MLRRVLTALALFALAPFAVAEDKPKESKLYELRIYTAEKGKLDAVNARFRDHTVKLFEKHGIANIGYWVPVKNDDEKLYYVIAHKDKAARDASFKAFSADPDWKKAAAESEKDGKIVKGIESILMNATDYSPEFKPSHEKGERIFEMRTYIATKDNLGNLNDRFKDHTVKLFEKYGMTNLGYYKLAKGSKGEDTTLLYFLAHKSEDAAKKSFDEFRQDKDWIAAKEASEKKGGGSLTEKEGGVKSLFLKPTDYSMTK